MGKVYIKAKQKFFKPGEAQMYFTKYVIVKNTPTLTFVL